MRKILNNESNQLLDKIAYLLEESRKSVVHQVDQTIVYTYRHIGREIVEFQQGGEERAEYGTELLMMLSRELTKKFGKGFSYRGLRKMRQFYLIFPIWPTLSAKFKNKNLELSSGESKNSNKPVLHAPSKNNKLSTVSKFYTLSRSHYVFLMQIKDADKRSFYAIEANENNRSLRELKRQFDTSLYHRLALSKNKNGIKKLAKHGQLIEKPEDALKEPYVLEFLGLEQKNVYSENDLESAIISNLQKFLLEMGKGWMFVERQKRINNNEENYYIDLVFYHRFLHCFILIDLKKGKLTHQDIGQMQMYVNYFDREVKKDDENSTIGLLLCEQNNNFVVKYTLPKDNKQIFSREYQVYLPNKKELEQLRRKICS